jgi:hypothetical protein
VALGARWGGVQSTSPSPLPRRRQTKSAALVTTEDVVRRDGPSSLCPPSAGRSPSPLIPRLCHLCSLAYYENMLGEVEACDWIGIF